MAKGSLMDGRKHHFASGSRMIPLSSFFSVFVLVFLFPHISCQGFVSVGADRDNNFFFFFLKKKKKKKEEEEEERNAYSSIPPRALGVKTCHFQHVQSKPRRNTKKQGKE